VKLFIVADVPDALAKTLLQHVRNFDMEHPGCHFKMSMQVPDMDIEQMVEALQIDPPFRYQTIIKKDEAGES
jgi:hypothetical protein